MDFTTLTAPCGIDCWNCGAHARNIDDQARALLRVVKPDLPDGAACQGCRASGCLIATDCGTRRCVLGKGLAFCFECESFPCQRLMPTRDKADRYPQNFKLYNLVRIERYGLERWAAEADAIRKRYFGGTLVIGEGPRLPGEPDHEEPPAPALPERGTV